MLHLRKERIPFSPETPPVRASGGEAIVRFPVPASRSSAAPARRSSSCEASWKARSSKRPCTLAHSPRSVRLSRSAYCSNAWCRSTTKTIASSLLVEAHRGPSELSNVEGVSRSGARVSRENRSDPLARRRRRPHPRLRASSQRGQGSAARREDRGARRHIALTSAACLRAGLVILLYFCWWWCSLIVLLLPLLIGVFYAFALISFPALRVTELNSNTAFMGSIIIGNGLNTGVILLARHREERRAGATVEEAIGRAIWGTRTATLSAALAAGVAYESLFATQFRGFRQFGAIGGLACSSAGVRPTCSCRRSSTGSIAARSRARAPSGR